jgi:HSP20 family protein
MAMTMTVPRTTRNLATTPTRRGDPFREIEEMQERMSLLMDGLFGVAPTMAVRMPAWQACADIEEADDAFIIDVDLPGVRPEDVNVEVRENELRLTGELKERDRKGILRRQTRRVGQFEHFIQLPGEVDPDKVEATLRDGVLSVRLAKSRSRQPKRVQIKGS